MIAQLLFAVFLYSVVGHEHDDEDYLLCRNCGAEIAKASDLVYNPSPLAIRQRNDTILGEPNVLIQLFKNPGGHHFEVITAEKTKATVKEQVYPADTWFKGYQWRMVVCQHCSAHLGWFYEPIGHHHHHQKEETTAEDAPTVRTFFGLILDRLIHQSYADSLLMTPKFYGS